jgi:glyoxylase-like metal-dependent hydrolase (beta-lactamase superfamily II)
MDRETERSRVLPKQVASGVHFIEAGSGITRSNVYFVRAGRAWVLVDAASANCADVIQDAATSLFGANAGPAAILLTHDHPDHAGSALELARRWDCPVYVHPDELRFATANAANFFSVYEPYTTATGRWAPPPLDRWMVLPMMRLMPRRWREPILSEASLEPVARAFDPGAGVPYLPGWECVPTPGHTPGHVAFFRPDGRVLIAGDAVVTVDLNSARAFLRWWLRRSGQLLSGPPWYTTWSRRAARRSVAAVARLDPLVIASGHGLPMSGVGTSGALRALADRL